MKDKELWLNGSGYPDPTAYKAMKGMVDMENRVGEVWEVNTHKGTKTVLVVAEKDGAFALLEMCDEPKQYADITVNVNGEDWHTNSIMFSYCLPNRFVEKVGTLSEDDFNVVLQTVGRTFDIPLMPVTDFVKVAHENTLEKNQIIEHLEEKNREFFNIIQDQDKEIERLKAEITKEPSTQVIELTAERNLYKTLYEQAFERLIAR